jgi:RNA polymerase sigma-B factor
VAISDDERARLRLRFDDYRRTGDAAIRDELVAAHLRLAVHLARRFEHRGVPLDDLTQVASVGLLQAIDRFEPQRGLEFSTFATPTIVGELKRHFRDKGWAVRVPRRIQELHGGVNTVVGELTHELGRSPTIAELARATRASEEEVLEAMEAAQAYRSTSLDAAGRGDHDGQGGPGDGADHLGGDDSNLFAVENRVLVERLMAYLSPREQLMVRLRFYEDMSQTEIAERLGISQMHVSRLLARCLATLRNLLDDRDDADATEGDR